MTTRAIVTCLLPLPWRRDRWKRAKALKGLSVVVRPKSRVCFEVEDDARAEAMKTLARLLAERTEGSLVVEGSSEVVELAFDPKNRRLFRELAIAPA